ncbi:MAG: DUF3365 domain-containing protein [Bacteroidota bacterium]
MKTGAPISYMIAIVLMLVSCQNPEQAQESSTPTKGEPTVVDIMFEQGDSLSQIAQMALGKALKGALQNGGVPEAIPYCNTQALPITDSLGDLFGIEIRRTALRVRNPVNQPIAAERQHLRNYQSMLDRGEELVPQLEGLANNKFLYSRPILLQGMCTSCHGEVGKTIKEEEYALIRDHYPQDSAINFGVGDLRGMWSITFDLEKVQAAMTATEPAP